MRGIWNLAMASSPTSHAKYSHPVKQSSHSHSFKVVLRRFVFALHLWVGLVLGLHFALLGLTGSLLVFHNEVDALLNPQILRVTPSEQRASADVLGEAEGLHEWLDDAEHFQAGFVDISEDNPLAFAHGPDEHTLLPFKRARVCGRGHIRTEKGPGIKRCVGEMDGNNMVARVRVQDLG